MRVIVGTSISARLRWLGTVLALMCAAGFAGLPLYWLVTGAFKQSTEINKLPPVWFPSQPTLDAFAEAARLLPLGSAFVNSFLIAGVSTAAVVARISSSRTRSAATPSRGPSSSTISTASQPGG